MEVEHADAFRDSVIYQNITEVVNLKCVKSHEKLRIFLQSLKQNRVTTVTLKPKPPQESQEKPVKRKASSSISIDESMDFAKSCENREYKSKNTLKAEALAWSQFERFVKKENQTVETLFEDKEKLQDTLIHYFYSWRTSQGEVPKRNTLESKKALTIQVILRTTKGKIDLRKITDFPKFNKFYKGYMTKLRIEGKGDAVSVSDIPQEHMKKIYEFLAYLQSIMNGTCQDLSRMPESEKNGFHYLAQQGAIFILMHYLSPKKTNRGSYHNLKIKDFAMQNDGKSGLVYKKINGQKDEFIPFGVNDYGLDCGEYLRQYIKKIQPGCPWLLPLPLKFMKAEGIGNRLLQSDHWFKSNKIGCKNLTIQSLCSALDLPKYKNNEIPLISDKTLAGPKPSKMIKVEEIDDEEEQEEAYDGEEYDDEEDLEDEFDDFEDDDDPEEEPDPEDDEGEFIYLAE